MKHEPEFQKQHQVSQVYLKQFGFKKDGKDWLSVFKVGTSRTENVLISEFSTEINIFDFEHPEIEPAEKRHFENLSGVLENKYITIINTLSGQGRLIPLHRDILNHFVANLLCRTPPFRSYINDLLNDSITRDILVEEVQMFSTYKDLSFLMQYLTGKNKLNMFIGFLMNNLVHIFRSFNATIIKAPKGYGWLTTDSPVLLDNQDELYHTIPIESEIYVPLSRNFCLFMYHKASKKNTNPLRKLTINKVNTIDFKTFDKVTNKVVRGYHQYLIFYTETEPQEIIPSLNI